MTESQPIAPEPHTSAPVPELDVDALAPEWDPWEETAETSPLTEAEEAKIHARGLRREDYLTTADARQALRETEEATMEKARTTWTEQPSASDAASIAKLDATETEADTIDLGKRRKARAEEMAALDSAPVPALLERFPVTTAGNLQAQFPTPPAPVIEGIIGKGEKLIFGGSSKAGKTYGLLNLASAIATGGKWLGHQCRKGRALFLNFEVGEARMAERNRLLERSGVPMAGVDFLNLRGAQFEWPELVEALEHLTARARYSLIILDPIYKLLGDTPENGNTEVAGMLAEVEAIAVETGAAVAFAHHFSKGNKAETASMDRLSGAGAFARDPDAILTLTEHEEPSCFVLEATVRNYASPEPVVVEYQFPRFSARTDLDSANLKQSKRGGGHNKKGSGETVVDVLRQQGGSLTSAALQEALVRRCRVSDRTARRWMKDALETGAVDDAQGLWTTP